MPLVFRFRSPPASTEGSTETGLVYLVWMEFPGFAPRPRGTEGSGKSAPVNHRRWESPCANPSRVTLPRPLSLSDFGNLFCPLARRNTKDFFLAPFLFSEIAAPATNGRQAIAPRARGRPAPAAGRPVLFMEFTAARGDRTRPPAPLSNGVNVDSTRLERAPFSVGAPAPRAPIRWISF